MLKKKDVCLVLIIVAFLFLGKNLLEVDIGKQLPRVPLRQVVSFLSQESPEETMFVATGVGFGFKEVVCDFLFLQTIQQFGDWNLKPEEKFKSVYPRLLVISLVSPHFIPVYSFGALILQELGHVDEAIGFLNKGIDKNPRAFELWLYRDFTIRLFKTGEYKKAIEGIKTALTIEGHPPILERILAFAYEKDGQIGEAVRQWKRVYTSTKDSQIKKICIRHIKRLRGKKLGP